MESLNYINDIILDKHKRILSNLLNPKGKTIGSLGAGEETLVILI